MTTLRIDGLPQLTWTHGETPASWDTATGELTLTAHEGVDWTNDALGAPQQHGSTLLGFAEPDHDFTLSAKVRVNGARTTFDAGVLGIWSDRDHWAKLCFECSPQGDTMVVSVVTNEYSDDCNSSMVTADHVWLRLTKAGAGYAFHASPDGSNWAFVRQFRIYSDAPRRVGFMSQAPQGEGCVAVFSDINLSTHVPADLRSGE